MSLFRHSHVLRISADDIDAKEVIKFYPHMISFLLHAQDNTTAQSIHTEACNTDGQDAAGTYNIIPTLKMRRNAYAGGSQDAAGANRHARRRNVYVGESKDAGACIYSRCAKIYMLGVKIPVRAYTQDAQKFISRESRCLCVHADAQLGGEQ